MSPTEVRREFTYTRHLLRLADRAMYDGITDTSDDGDAYQLALEIQASAGAFIQYLDEMREKEQTP